MLVSVPWQTAVYVRLADSGKLSRQGVCLATVCALHHVWEHVGGGDP
jgi:hypothetical protein